MCLVLYLLDVNVKIFLPDSSAQCWKWSFSSFSKIPASTWKIQGLGSRGCLNDVRGQSTTTPLSICRELYCQITFKGVIRNERIREKRLLGLYWVDATSLEMGSPGVKKTKNMEFTARGWRSSNQNLRNVIITIKIVHATLVLKHPDEKMKKFLLLDWNPGYWVKIEKSRAVHQSIKKRLGLW